MSGDFNFVFDKFDKINTNGFIEPKEHKKTEEFFSDLDLVDILTTNRSQRQVETIRRWSQLPGSK